MFTNNSENTNKFMGKLKHQMLGIFNINFCTSSEKT